MIVNVKEWLRSLDFRLGTLSAEHVALHLGGEDLQDFRASVLQTELTFDTFADRQEVDAIRAAERWTDLADFQDERRL